MKKSKFLFCFFSCNEIEKTWFLQGGKSGVECEIHKSCAFVQKLIILEFHLVNINPVILMMQDKLTEVRLGKVRLVLEYGSTS